MQTTLNGFVAIYVNMARAEGKHEICDNILRKLAQRRIY